MSTAPDQAYAVELLGITKAFPGVVANDDVSLALRRGEVHCLLGENGAGKSTLMAILAGMQQPDAGEIRVDGQEVRIDSPRVALELGIGTVYQHSTLIGALTVLENLMLGDSRALRLDAAGARARLQKFSAMLGRRDRPRRAKAGDLALGRQQQVEIIKALWRGSRVLILDEPTSMLTPQAVTELQNVLRPAARRRGWRWSSSPTSSTRRWRSATGSRSCARAASPARSTASRSARARPRSSRPRSCG